MNLRPVGNFLSKLWSLVTLEPIRSRFNKIAQNPPARRPEPVVVESPIDFFPRYRGRSSRNLTTKRKYRGELVKHRRQIARASRKANRRAA